MSATKLPVAVFKVAATTNIAVNTRRPTVMELGRFKEGRGESQKKVKRWRACLLLDGKGAASSVTPSSGERSIERF